MDRRVLPRDSLCHTTDSMTRLIFLFVLLNFTSFYLGGSLQGQRIHTKGRGNKWVQGVPCERHKE